mgnify:CR=1 FL=1
MISLPIFFENSAVPKILSKVSPISIGAITVGPVVFCDGEISESLKRHESIHWEQYKECLIIGFLLLYAFFSPPGPGEQGSADEMPGEMHRVTNDSKGEVIGPFEYKLAAAIADEFEQHELSQKTQGTGPSWPQEVNNAGSELEEALLDSGALDSLLRLVDDIAIKLHNGEYA